MSKEDSGTPSAVSAEEILPKVGQVWASIAYPGEVFGVESQEEGRRLWNCLSNRTGYHCLGLGWFGRCGVLWSSPYPEDSFAVGMTLDRWREYVGAKPLDGAPAHQGSEATARPVMEADSNGFPVGCLRCGKKPMAEDEAYYCDACPEDDYIEHESAWRAGARDFPRAAKPPTTTPTTAETTGEWIDRQLGEEPEAQGKPHDGCHWSGCEAKGPFGRDFHGYTICWEHYKLSEKWLALEMRRFEESRHTETKKPETPSQPQARQSHVHPRGCLGIWSLRDTPKASK